MHCLDCLTGGDVRDAVAICRSCGAGVCVDHAAALTVHLVRMGVILREERVEPPAREMICPTCLAARHAAERSPSRAGRHRFTTVNA